MWGSRTLDQHKSCPKMCPEEARLRLLTQNLVGTDWENVISGMPTRSAHDALGHCQESSLLFTPKSHNSVTWAALAPRATSGPAACRSQHRKCAALHSVATGSTPPAPRSPDFPSCPLQCSSALCLNYFSRVPSQARCLPTRTYFFTSSMASGSRRQVVSSRDTASSAVASVRTPGV